MGQVDNSALQLERNISIGDLSSFLEEDDTSWLLGPSDTDAAQPHTSPTLGSAESRSLCSDAMTASAGITSDNRILSGSSDDENPDSKRKRVV